MSAPTRHPDCLKLRTPWSRGGGAATGIRAKEIEVKTAALDVRQGGHTQDVPREAFLTVLLMNVSLSTCLCGSEAQVAVTPPLPPMPISS